MSTSQVTSATPERASVAHKQAWSKGAAAGASGGSGGGQFAALLLQADESQASTNTADTTTERKQASDTAQAPTISTLLPHGWAWQPSAPTGDLPTGKTANANPASAASALTNIQAAQASTGGGLASGFQGANGASQAQNSQSTLYSTAFSAPKKEPSLVTTPATSTPTAGADGTLPPGLAERATPGAASTENAALQAADAGKQGSGTDKAGTLPALTADKFAAGAPTSVAASGELPTTKFKPGTGRSALNLGQGSSAVSTGISAQATAMVHPSRLAQAPDTATPSATQTTATLATDQENQAKLESANLGGTPVTGGQGDTARPSPDPSWANQPGAGPDASSPAPAMPDAPPLSAHEAMEQAMEKLSAQVSYWATQGSQRASLTIGGDQSAPLDVSIAFDKGEVSVHFETDEASVRDALQTDAQTTLDRLLDAKGMSLGSVSVGLGQNDARQPSQQPPSETGQPSSRAAFGTQTTGQAAPAPMPRQPNIISANKLDFFA